MMKVVEFISTVEISVSSLGKETFLIEICKLDRVSDWKGE